MNQNVSINQIDAFQKNKELVNYFFEKPSRYKNWTTKVWQFIVFLSNTATIEYLYFWPVVNSWKH